MVQRDSIIIRKATVADVPSIQKLINDFAGEGLMLPLSLVEIYEQVRDFAVAYVRNTNELVGSCALHLAWEDLAEIRSLAVNREYQKLAVGRDLVAWLLEEAKTIGVTKVFVLTYVPEFFARLGFTPSDKARLPHKVWADCIKCHKFPNCDEEAMQLEIV